MRKTEPNRVEVGGYGLVDLSKVTRVSEVMSMTVARDTFYITRVFFETPIDIDKSGNSLYYIQKWSKTKEDMEKWREKFVGLITPKKEKTEVVETEMQNPIESLDPNP